MTNRCAALVAEQILLRHVRDIFRFVVFGEQMVEGLILAGPHFSRNRLLPFLGIRKFRIDIKNHAPEWKEPVLYDLADAKFGGFLRVHDDL